MSKYLNDAYTLRIPADLKAKVSESAKGHNRSMNADIVARLEQTFANTESRASEIDTLRQEVAEITSAYRQSIAHYDRILKLLEQKVDLQSLLLKKD